MGFTHIELLPVMAHPFTGSWGYQVTGYFAPTPRFGSPDDFREFVDRLHQNGVGVILDWVPAHFPRDDFALARFDGTALYEHADPRRGAHPDWGTLVFNYGRHEVRNFLVSNALFWLEEYHADGIRVDAVASMLYLDYSREEGEWVPNEYGGNEDLDAVAFLKEYNEVIHAREPGVISAAEESTAWPGVSRPTYLGGLGFGFKWNMGWMHDTLAYFQNDPIYRRYHHHELTFSLVYAFTENFILPLSHDEVVHGKGSLLTKMPGDRWQKLANLRSLYAYMWAHPGKKLLFMGQEFAQEQEWSENRSLDWHLLENPEHAGIQSLVRDLNTAYKAEPALWEMDFDGTGFWWTEANAADDNVIAFARRTKDSERVALFVGNFSPTVRYELPDRPARAAAAGARRSTPTRRTTAARASGTWAASTPRRSAGTASRSRPRSRCRRWRALWLVPEETTELNAPNRLRGVEEERRLMGPVSGLLWLAGAAVAVVGWLLPGSPHDHVALFWGLVALTVVYSLACITRLIPWERVSLGGHALAVVALQPLVVASLWLTGGADAYMGPVLVLPMLYVAYFFPARYAWPLAALEVADLRVAAGHLDGRRPPAGRPRVRLRRRLRRPRR